LEVAAVSSVVALCVVLLLHRDGGYRGSGSPLHIGETERALRVSAQSLVLLLPFSFLFKLNLSHTAFAIAFIVTSSLLILRKQMVSSLFRTLHSRGSVKQHVAVYGAGDNHGVLRPVRQHAASWHYAIAKRALDLIVSSSLLVLLAPVFLLIGCLIRLDSPGPALFVQKRVGRNGKLFDIYKFRSMYTNACKYEPSPTTSFDPRITRLGRLLRRSCLDELPQLMNVLRGTMSLVGPRPEMPFIVRNYDSRQQQRLQAIPGITGMWQLSADRSLPIHENVEYDLYYIRNRALFMDIAILIHTLFYAIGEGV
jgi:lipopolysaccharide/colanic/teichoic acid biosynthesis glycosyltransferase